MKTTMCLCSILFLAAAVVSQNASSVTAKGAKDEVRQRAGAAGTQDSKGKQPDGPGRLASPPCAIGEHAGPEFGCPWKKAKEEGRLWKRHEEGKGRQLRYHRFLVLKAFAGMMFLGLIAYAAVNVLLTILVSIDMARLGRFNGLWIPILLLVGIPGTALYALFRIGDIMRNAQTRG